MAYFILNVVETLDLSAIFASCDEGSVPPGVRGEEPNMSIYATLWRLKFPKDGDDYFGCDWTEVMAQGVPAHIGSPTPGCGYEDGDPYAEFLPPALETNEDGEHEYMRAVVILRAGTPKGTARSAQEYTSPLLVLTGEEYSSMSFEALHERICEALRGGRPRLVAQVLTPDGGVELIYEEEEASEGSRPGEGRPS